MTARPERHVPARSGDGEFDVIIHAPARLRLCATLQMFEEVEFSGMLEILEISKSALSKHIATLVEAGYVRQRRATRDTRQRVWLSLTDTGRAAYQRHVSALRQIVGAT
ncbi:MAG: transcriptional regulator [Pseudonocardia sp.]|nr:transcriptional regulator [Pseudonocardia sp.]